MTFSPFPDDLWENKSSTANLRALVDRGCWALWAEIFGQSFVDVLAVHHREAIEWHWDSRIALLTGGRPDYLAYFPIWPRGHLKSTIAERMVIVDALLSVAYGQAGYTLYIAQNKQKIQENIGNIESLLSSLKVREYAPQLSQVARNEETNQRRQWQATLLRTSGNYTIKGGSIESALAGSRFDETRPTFFVPDDIDGREDSPVISETRYNRLTSEILPMRQSNSLVFFAQNLISRYSVMYRIYSGHSKALANRKPTVPIPAVRNMVVEQRTIDGVIRDVFISGESTWPFWTPERIQDEIDTMTLPVFERECQHNVEQSAEGLILYNYNDAVHPISYSEFAAVYGSESAWKDWYKVVFNDYARTKTKYHANVGGYLAVSSQNTKLPGLTFLIPVSFKANTAPEDMGERFLSLLTPYAIDRDSERQTWRDLIDEAWKRLNENVHFTDVSDRLTYLKSYYAQLIPKYARPVLERYNVKAGAISHSEDKLREGLNFGFGFNFSPSNPGKNDAIEDINAAMRVDMTEDHLFHEGKGYTRFYVLCADDLTGESRIVNGRIVYPPVPYKYALSPDELHDADLFRYQMLNCRNRDPFLTESGEVVDEPLKINDDFKQGLQLVYYKGLLRNIPLTKTEKFIATMPASVQKVEIGDETVTDAEKISANLWKQKEFKRLNEEAQRKNNSWQSKASPRKSQTGKVLREWQKLKGK